MAARIARLGNLSHRPEPRNLFEASEKGAQPGFDSKLVFTLQSRGEKW